MENNKISVLYTSIKMQLSNFKTLAIRYGQFKSIITKQSIDAFGKEIPWYTYPAIEYLNQFDFSDKEVFEYGCGNSSIYWAKKAKNVISVDNNKEWYDLVYKRRISNHKIIFVDKKNKYVDSIDKYNKKFDIIIY